MEETREWYHETMNLKEAESYINANLVSAVRAYVANGFYLKRIREDRLFEEDGYQNFDEYVRDRYGKEKGWASKCIKVNSQLSVGGDSPILDSRYRDYSVYQLVELAYMDEEERSQTDPAQSVKELREMRKAKEIPYFELPGQLSLETDFPEIMPEGMDTQPEEQPSEAFTVNLNLADLMGEDTELGEVVTLQPELELLEEQQKPEESVQEAAEQLSACGTAKKEQPEFPRLKNNDQRSEWLNAFRDWPVWFSVQEASEVYYRYDLPDESSLVICEFHYWAEWKLRYQENADMVGTREYLLVPGYHYLHDCKSNRTAMIEKLKEIQKRG